MAEETRRAALFSVAFAQRIVRAVKLIESFRLTGSGATFHKGKESMSARVTGVGPGSGLRRLLIKDIGNDHLVCREWDGQSEGTLDVLVAKPQLLQHDVDLYPQLTTLVTVDEQTVTAGDGSGTETWVVSPAYTADLSEVLASPFASGLTVGGQPVLLMDTNMAGRVWAEPEE